MIELALTAKLTIVLPFEGVEVELPAAAGGPLLRSWTAWTKSTGATPGVLVGSLEGPGDPSVGLVAGPRDPSVGVGPGSPKTLTRTEPELVPSDFHNSAYPC